MVSLQEFLPILGTPQPKITNRSYWPACDQMVHLTSVRPKPRIGHFEVRLWVKFSKFWPEKTSDLYVNGPECFPPWFVTKFRFGLFEEGATKWVKFPNFSPGESITYQKFTLVVPEVSPQNFLPVLGVPTAEKYKSVFLTSMRPNDAFDQRATKTASLPIGLLEFNEWIPN